MIESNSRVLAAMVHEWGGTAHRLGIVGDDEDAAVVEELLAEHDLAGGLVAVGGDDRSRARRRSGP